MPRQRPRRVARRDARALRCRSRSSSATNTRSWRGSPRASATAGASWPTRPTPAPRSGRRRRRSRRSGPATRNGSRDRLEAHGDAERVAQLLDDALDVEEVDLARAARPVLGARRAGPGHARRRAFRRAARSACRSRTAARRAGRGGGCARRRRRGPAAATAAACRTWPESGFAMHRRRSAGSRVRGRANASAAFASMKPNVTASDRPAAVSTRRTS